MPFGDGCKILQGKGHPSAKQPGSHGRNGAVYHLEQRSGPFVKGVEEFQIPDGKPVEPHIMLLLDPAEAGDVGNLFVLSKFQVAEDGT